MTNATTTNAKTNRSRPDWATKGIDGAALEVLNCGLPATGLWSLLLGVADERAKSRSSADLQRQWQNDRFVAPAYVDQRKQLAMDSHLLAVASDFEALELSPLAPLGVCSAIAPTSQNRVVSTMRGTEVVSDPTNVLALESARRLRLDSAATVKLATSHRCVRAQSLPNRPGMAAHFKLFCITTAGHETNDHNFLVNAFVEHLRFHLNAFERLNQHGYRLHHPTVQLSVASSRAHLVARITAAFPNVTFEQQLLTQDYYHGIRFTISARSPTGEDIALSDGGAFNWLEKLTANRKMVFVASAIGSQRAAALFSE
jgi:hypothetical protein